RRFSDTSPSILFKLDSSFLKSHGRPSASTHYFVRRHSREVPRTRDSISRKPRWPSIAPHYDLSVLTHGGLLVRLRVREWLLLLGFCVFLFFYGLGQFGLVGADEPRYAQVTREMLARHDWVTPTLNGTPWLEKPPLYYWQAMIAFAIFGVRDSVARLPSA